ncbi:D-alanyl-D-alanine carboxypeptidase family protein [Crassaminicella profunda]|uniref:D-alanyl-D-alanine carboxypeptidase family protein n=1 Tax=Crassaminicella profunda TaxID=1286698 RepID=UPI001CA796AE|nr:D-alanyl-D-alanine carboxypeptidase family protein [Crassaminicella profunda]QZY54974.1 D-alanyl-D-alanine carboxypeptidase [Crassaminicella profunda]
MRRYIAIIITCILLLASPSSFADAKVKVNARAALLMEETSGEILFSKNVEERFAPASITKLMTYLVAIEAVEKGKVSMNDLVTISDRAANEKGASYRLKAGETIKLSELMEAMMIVSANDAAFAIAEHVGSSMESFVKMMNAKAKELGMVNTNFVNPNGMPEKGEGNMMTAKDIGILAKYIIQHHKEELLPLTDQEFYQNPERNFYKKSTNGLLKIIPEVDGLKTGYTSEAGFCLTSTMNVKKKDENEQDFRLISVVLGTKSDWNRVHESERLLNYGVANFMKKRIINVEEPIQEIKLWGAKELPIELLAKENAWAFGQKNAIEKSREISLLDTMPFPVVKGQKLGEVKVTLYNDKVITMDLISDRDVKKIPFKVFIKKFWSIFSSLIANIM